MWQPQQVRRSHWAWWRMISVPAIEAGEQQARWLHPSLLCCSKVKAAFADHDINIE